MNTTFSIPIAVPASLCAGDVSLSVDYLDVRFHKAGDYVCIEDVQLLGCSLDLPQEDYEALAAMVNTLFEDLDEND